MSINDILEKIKKQDSEIISDTYIKCAFETFSIPNTVKCIGVIKEKNIIYQGYSIDKLSDDPEYVGEMLGCVGKMIKRFRSLKENYSFHILGFKETDNQYLFVVESYEIK